MNCYHRKKLKTVKERQRGEGWRGREREREKENLYSLFFLHYEF
jgi:hypothetical protein